MKKIIIGLFTLFLSLFFVSCGPSGGNDNDKDNNGYDSDYVDPDDPQNQIFTVTIDEDNGSPIRQETCHFGETLNIKDPVKEGYRFLEWISSDGNHFSSKDQITEDLSIKANYEKVFKIKFVMNGYDEETKILTADDTIQFPYPNFDEDPEEKTNIEYWYTKNDDGTITKYEHYDYPKVEKDETFYAFIVKYFYINDMSIYYYIEDNEAIIYRIDSHFYLDKTELLNIPDEIKGYKVTRFDDDIKYNLNNMSLFLPKHFRELPQNFADNFKNLDFISIPKSMKAIPNNVLSKDKNTVAIAYEGTEEEFKAIDKGENFSLSENTKVLYNRQFETIEEKKNNYASYILIDNDIVTKVSMNKSDLLSYLDFCKKPIIFDIGNFIYSTRPTGAILPDCMETIPDKCFYDCNLNYIELPKKLKKIGDYAFSRTNMNSIELPDSLEYIGDFAFNDNKFNHLKLPKNLKHIGKGFINGSSNTINITVDPLNTYFVEDKVNKIIIDVANNAVLHGFRDSKIPTNIKNIAPYALQNGIDDVASLQHIEKLGEGALAWAELDNHVYFNKLVEIGNKALHHIDNCHLHFGNLKKVGTEVLVNSTCSVTIANESIYKIQNNCLYDTVNKAVISGFKGFSIPSDCKIIREGAFSFEYRNANKNYIHNLTIPSSVEVIEKNAFSNVVISYLKLNEGLKFIGQDAFDALDVEYLSLPSTLEKVEQNGINIFEGFKYVYIPNLKCEEFDINFPYNVGKGIIKFGGSKEELEKLCSSIFIYKDLVEAIEFNATNTMEFIESDKYTYVKEGNKIHNFVNLDRESTSINLEEFNSYELFELGEYAFSNFNNLENITLPNNIKVIPTGTFNGTKLLNVVIPDGVEIIENNALVCEYDFDYSIYIPKSVKEIAENFYVGECIIVYQGTEEEFNNINFADDSMKQTKIKYFNVESDAVKYYTSGTEHPYGEYKFVTLNGHVEHFYTKSQELYLEEIYKLYPDLKFDAHSFDESPHVFTLYLPAVETINFNIFNFFPNAFDVVIPKEVKNITTKLVKQSGNYEFFLETNSVPRGFITDWNNNKMVYLRSEWENTQYGPRPIY